MQTCFAYAFLKSDFNALESKMFCFLKTLPLCHFTFQRSQVFKKAFKNKMSHGRKLPKFHTFKLPSLAYKCSLLYDIVLIQKRKTR